MKVTPWLILIFLLLYSGFCFSQNRKEFYFGYAKSSNGALLYEEHHEVEFNAERIIHSNTKYYKADGKHFATMDSDYSKSVEMPTYSFIDMNRGYEEGLYFKNGKYFIYFQEKNKEREIKELEEEFAFSCQGWHYFLVNNLEKIDQDNLKFLLILPRKLAVFKFEFEKIKSTNQLLEVNLYPSNWFIRIFAPSLRLIYDKTSKKLVQYNGVSNIQKENGDTQEVEITYKYERNL